MESTNKNNTLGGIIQNNIKAVVLVICFIVGLYLNNQINTVQIGELKKQLELLEVRQSESYKKIDEIKLDKAVFQATMNQLTPIQDELKEVRADIKEILKNLSGNRK